MAQSAPPDKPQSGIRGKGTLALLATFLASLWVPWLLSLVSCFLSLWIVIPAPTFSLLPLGVGTPEVSPWLVVVNAIALLLVALRLQSSWIYGVALGVSLLGLLLSLLPLIQFPAANARIATAMEAEFGAAVLTPPISQVLRSHPFVWIDAFRGIRVPEVRVDRGIPFATVDGVKLTLNLYRPSTVGLHPAIAVIYGGAWQAGTPANDETFSRYMAAQGYTVVALDYRHAPQFRYPAQLEDVRTALSFIQTQAEAFEIDRQRIALLGRSAGAHLASLLAYGQSPLPIRAIVNYYGPTNLIEGYTDPPVPDPINTCAILEAFLGGNPDQVPQIYQEASPVNHISPNLPPSLLVYPSRDHIVLPRFGRQLHEKLQASGNQAALLEIPWAEHAFDAVFNGVSNQLALYYTERFLAWALRELP
ncbi:MULTISPECIES: alpha/beta hydrolase [unclassified Leptolyngbya]|uniref:alpha/beta hydrolase n=1 Tax=unclassified Leptolyngbya TaxID=2650499 RepID=UPI0016850D17|nr:MULTISPECIES: alpha/beta hydrolase [unclassified Leptolyngbya]MBD1913832.1 alpha/beta hydrolase [Leptolyngbya sp. FACHB-8]MBD2157342.1 alpha/beta hydrolase [Leptolyngbya sp. FACHB-16]